MGPDPSLMASRAARILVEEEEYFIRLLLVNSLQTAGYDVLEARDGFEALHLADDPGGVDAVVSDVIMPGANGVAVAQHVRQAHPEVPVILISGRQDQLQGNAFLQPYRGFLKPVHPEQLLKTLKDMLTDRRARQH